jgi:hypothetical protein
VHPSFYLDAAGVMAHCTRWPPRTLGHQIPAAPTALGSILKGVAMSDSESEAEPGHLTHHHRATLEKIFQHPVAHNLEWNDVRSLLNAIAEVDEKHDGKFTVTMNGRSETIERPKNKDLEAQEVIDVRRLLESAGYGPTSK